MWLLVTQKTIDEPRLFVLKTNPWYSESWLPDYGWLEGIDRAIACTAFSDPNNPLFNLLIPRISHQTRSYLGFVLQLPFQSHYDISIMTLGVQFDTYSVFPVWLCWLKPDPKTYLHWCKHPPIAPNIFILSNKQK